MEGPANIIWNAPQASAAGAAAITWNEPRITPADYSSAPSAGPAQSNEFMPFGEDGLTFLDFLDIINPLQHIPIISTVYRYLTGDEISPASRIAGGALFGGIIGAAISVANVIVEYASGKDMGEHVLSLFIDGKAAETLTAGTDAILNGAGLNGAGLNAAPEIVWNGPRPAAAPAGTASLALNASRLSPQTHAALMPLQNTTAVTSAPLAAAAVLADKTPDVFAAVRRAKDVSALPAAPGATAAGGGWFSATMVTALEKYQQGAMLNERPPSPALNISQ